MSNVLKIKSRQTGAAGAPGSLARAELAYNEQDNTLYIGHGSGTDADRTKNAIGGKGAFVDLASTQTLTNKTISGNGAGLTSITAGNLNGVVPSGNLPEADTSTSGIIETATSAETTAGTATDRALTPAGLAGSTAVTGKKLNEFTAPDGSVSMGSQKITSLATPTLSTDAANKSYVDANSSGLDVKESVRLATTTAVGSGFPDLSSAPTIDGVTVQDGDRVLVKDQSTASENGIWTWSDSGTIFVRATDFDTNTEVTAGAFTFVEEGTVNADSGWVLTTNDDITVGTTGLAFAQFSGAGQITAGDGIYKSGNTLSVLLVPTGGLDFATHGGREKITVNYSDANALGTLSVAKGGTGATSLTADGILYGNGTSAIQATAEGNNNQILYSNNGTPAWTTTPAGLTIDCGTY